MGCILLFVFAFVLFVFAAIFMAFNILSVSFDFFIFGSDFPSLVIFDSELVIEVFRILLFCTNLTTKYASDDINIMDTILLLGCLFAVGDFLLFI